jgi:hypothetical protein
VRTAVCHKSRLFGPCGGGCHTRALEEAVGVLGIRSWLTSWHGHDISFSRLGYASGGKGILQGDDPLTYPTGSLQALHVVKHWSGDAYEAERRRELVP